MPIAVNRLSPALGGEVVGADLNDAADEVQFQTIRRALLEHCVIVIRDQRIGPEAHIAFSRRFGELSVHVLDSFLLPGHPEILLISNKKENGRAIGVADAGRHWHSDMSYDPVPPLGSLLHAIEIPPEGGQTMFVNMYAVYEALPDSLKARIAGRKAVYSYTRDYTKFRERNADRPELTAEQKAKLTGATHPMVRTHPETGRKALYVNPGHTVGILGMAEDEAKPLLDELFAFSTLPEFRYVHEWRPHDLVFWDNRCTMHHALPYDPKYTRHMHRTTVMGDRPY